MRCKTLIGLFGSFYYNSTKQMIDTGLRECHPAGNLQDQLQLQYRVKLFTLHKPNLYLDGSNL